MGIKRFREPELTSPTIRWIGRKEQPNLVFATACRRILILLKLTMSAGFNGTVDFASGSPVSVNAVVQTMAKVLDVKVTIRHEGHTEEYIRFHTVDPTMRERFGVTPRISFEDGVRKLHAFLLQERNGAGQPA